MKINQPFILNFSEIVFNKLQKRLFTTYLFLIFIFLPIHCKSKYFIREYIPTEKIHTHKYKIALVGFYPYSYNTSVSSENGNLDYTSSYKDLFPLGQPIEEIPSKGLDESVKSEAVKEFF